MATARALSAMSDGLRASMTGWSVDEYVEYLTRMAQASLLDD